MLVMEDSEYMYT